MVIFNRAPGYTNGPDNIPAGIFYYYTSGESNQAAI